MPIDMLNSIRKTSQWAFSSSLLNKLLGSSIFVAITVSMVMILLVAIMYPAQRGTSFAVLIKMFIYMFFTSLLIVFLHDGIIKYMFDEEENEQDDMNIMKGADISQRDVVYGNTPLINPQASQAQANSQTIQASNQTIQGNTPVVKGGDQNEPVATYIEGGGGILVGGRVPRKPSNPFK